MEPANFKQDTVIGNWRIGKLLGRGGQGGVWVARPTKTKNAPPRALKACFATELKDRARFEREAALLQGCKSPLIVTVHDLDLAWKAHVPSLPEFAYYVAEGCEGSLEQLREQLGDAGGRIKLFAECCNSVQYLHGLPEPIIHRDIKPPNFLLAAEPKRVVLSDLGIARYEAVASDLTVPQEVVGSRYYRPPEAMNGDPGSVRGDIYSLGRVFEWLMTGDVSTNFSTRPVPRGDYLSDELCDALDRVIVKATQPSPENRFGSVAELLAQIPDRWVSVRPRTVAVTAPAPEDLRAIVEIVLDLARKADTIAMRSLEQDLRKVFPTAVTTWRQKYENQTISEQTLPAVVDDLLNHTFGRLALGLAGVWSQGAGFLNQQRALADIITIPGWNRGGRTLLIAGPRGLAYFFHHLHGAICAELNRLDLALSMANVQVPQENRDASLPLWKQLDLTSAPGLFGDNADLAWKYLRSMRGKLPVLEKFFALPNDFEVGLATYSMLLCMLEFATDAAKLAKLPADQFQGANFDVYPMFAEMPTEVVAAAAARTFGDREVVAATLARAGAKREDLVSIWPHLKAQLNRFRGAHNRPFMRELPLGDLA